MLLYDLIIASFASMVIVTLLLSVLPASLSGAPGQCALPPRLGSFELQTPPPHWLGRVCGSWAHMDTSALSGVVGFMASAVVNGV